MSLEIHALTSAETFLFRVDLTACSIPIMEIFYLGEGVSA